MIRAQHVRPWAGLALGLLLAACGGVSSDPPDASIDAVVVDTPDIDTPPPDLGPPRLDLTAGGHLTGGTLVVDVQLGHSLAPRPAAGGTLTATPSAPVVP